MSTYLRDGAAILGCRKCDHHERIEWVAGDRPIYVPEHCGEVMEQLTHNDGKTPLEEPCPSYCCPAFKRIG